MTRQHSASRQSGVRKYLKYNVCHFFRRYKTLRKVKQLGKKVYVDRDVQVLRHPERVVIEENVVLKQGVIICPTNPEAQVLIGRNTTVGYHTMIFATLEIRIGADCLIAPFNYFVDADHGIEKSSRINTQPMSAKPIVVCDDVWLGTGCKILAGVTIGEGAVVAAGSVVNKDVPPYAIVAGTPIRKIGDRS